MSTTPIVYSTSAALLFTEQELGGPCLEQESYPGGGTVNPYILVPGNGDRVGLVIMNTGASTVAIGLGPNPANGQGIIIPSAGGFLSLTVRDDFTLPTRQWSAAAVTGGSSFYVLEIIRYKNL